MDVMLTHSRCVHSWDNQLCWHYELLVKIQNNSILPPTSSSAQHRVHDFWYAQHAL